MTLGCGSWGGNVTSDNISPWHLMDIKRVAFETRPVPSKRPARAAQQQSAPLRPAPTLAGGGSVGYTTEEIGRGRPSREEIAKIVDRFLSQRQPSQPAPQPSAQPLPVANPHSVLEAGVDIEPQRVAHSGGAAPHPEAAPTAQGNGGTQHNVTQRATNGGAESVKPTAQPEQPRQAQASGAQSNGHKAVDFVCEDDVRRAIQKGEKIYTNARTIITPAARDMGEAAEVFAKA
jgi:hypothetical protein